MKLLFVDLDETLLNTDKTISDINLNAIDKMIDAGHGFVINTGRPLLSAQNIAKKYGFTRKGCYISSFNGGMIVKADTNEVIYQAGVSNEDAKMIFKNAKKRGIHTHTYVGDIVVSEKETDMLLAYTKSVGLEYKIVDDACDYAGGIVPKIICADLTDHKLLEDFKEQMSPLVKNKLYCIFSNPMLLEFGSLMASKGIAIEKLCELLDVAIEDTVGAGDEENDIDMIKTAGIGVAMCNGIQNVKSIADYITVNDNNHGGIAEVIEKFILN